MKIYNIWLTGYNQMNYGKVGDKILSGVPIYRSYLKIIVWYFSIFCLSQEFEKLLRN